MFGRQSSAGCKTRTIFTHQYSFYTAEPSLYKQTSLAIISHLSHLACLTWQTWQTSHRHSDFDNPFVRGISLVSFTGIVSCSQV